MDEIEIYRKDFAKKLRCALKDLGISEFGQGTWLADKMKVTPKAASKWLNAETTPRPSKWEKLAATLEKPAHYFSSVSASGTNYEVDLIRPIDILMSSLSRDERSIVMDWLNKKYSNNSGENISERNVEYKGFSR